MHSLRGALGHLAQDNSYLPVANIPPGRAALRSTRSRAQSGVPGRCCTLGVHPCRVGKDSPRCCTNREECGLESGAQRPCLQRRESFMQTQCTAIRSRGFGSYRSPETRSRAHTIFANTGLTANVTPAKLPIQTSAASSPPPRLAPPTTQYVLK